MKGKLRFFRPELHFKCDICDKPRSQGRHTRCSKIRQDKHEQMLRNEAFDNALMFDKKE